MVEIERFSIASNDIKLEVELFQSISNKEKPIILICHPHPQYGGNMFNNVVSSVFNALIKNNISCLRFNFRGVGRSTGNHSDGSGELSDVHACIDFLIDERHFKKIILCGYSYGAAVGCSAVNYSEKIIGYISISFPWGFMGLKYKEMSQTSKPKLFIQGNRDTIPIEENYSFYYDPKRKKMIDGADHFYGGYEDQVANEVLDFYHSIC
ncbi:MAG: alpha/beta hydrolase [Promethearchaeota archaeon]|jgi:alpha/beta superfamily hydrolase